MRYAPFDELAGQPNVIVDGPPTAGTVLTLSHWPTAEAPVDLQRDLSAEIAFAYLDRPDLHVEAELISNNHLDEDGTVGVFALVEPELALRHRERLIEVARAGDFAVTNDRTASRIATAVASLIAEPGSSYPVLLDALPSLLEDPEGARDRWAADDEHLERSLAVFAAGRAVVREHPELELSVVVTEEPDLHPIAVHGAVAHFAVLQLVPGRPWLEDRYERWIRYVSRRPRQRVDLRPLAEQLGSIDSVTWRAGAPSDLSPTMRPNGESSLPAEVVERLVVDHLRSAPPAFDPWAS